MIKFKIINMFFKKILLVLNCFFTLHAKKKSKNRIRNKRETSKRKYKKSKMEKFDFLTINTFLFLTGSIKLRVNYCGSIFKNVFK